MKPLRLCDDCNLTQIARMCTEKHFGIEVQSFYDPAYPERQPDAVELHRHAIADIPDRSLHGPFGDLCPGSFDTMVREVARNRFETAASIARQLDINHMVLHHGRIPKAGPSEPWIKRSIAFWRDFLADKPPTLRIHLENLFDLDPAEILEVVSRLDDPRMDVCLDIGHCHCFSKTSAVEWIERLGERIGYVHLHDNHGEEDEHLALGAGNMPMDDVCHALVEYAPDAIWALEATVGDQVEKSVTWLQTHGYI